MSKKLTTEQFIEKARKIHGDKYDYSKVNYINAFEKITIICPIHGEFDQKPHDHLSRKGCAICGKEFLRNSQRSNAFEFIKKARKIHGDKYDYSKINYINSKTKICIICPEHGEFWQIPNGHLRGHGCPVCYNDLICHYKAEFIEKARSAHGDKYDYSKTNYVNSETKVCIICPEHGEFWQVSGHHLKGSGCPKCYGDNAIRIMHSDNFIKNAIAIHGDKYDYSKTNYVNSETKVTIICPEHGEFEQLPYSHLRGHGCHFCKRSVKYSSDEFIEKARSVHGNKYDYSKTNYVNSETKITIICPIHGEFEQLPYSHLQGCGCYACGSSLGEQMIECYLNSNDIKYEREKTFDGLIGTNGGKLRFDFYLPTYNICIEFDGEQHYRWCSRMMSYEEFLVLQKHDNIKNAFCIKEGIGLLRIRKSSIRNVSSKIENFINHRI